MSSFAVLKRDTGFQSDKRVTIHFSDGAPTLHMRFSALDMPSPAAIAESVKSRPPSEWLTPSTKTYSPSLYYADVPLPSRTVPDLPQTRYESTSAGPGTRGDSSIYARRFSESDTKRYSDSLSSINAVRELTAQFPGLPPRVTRRSQGSQSRPPFVLWEDPYGRRRTQDSGTTSSGTLSANNSLSRRKPAPTTGEELDPFTPSAQSLARSGSDMSTNTVTKSNIRVHTRGLSNATTQDTTPQTTTTSTPFNAVATPTSLATTPGTGNPFHYDNYPIPAQATLPTIPTPLQDRTVIDLPGVTIDDPKVSAEEQLLARGIHAPPRNRPPTDELDWLKSAATGGVTAPGTVAPTGVDVHPAHQARPSLSRIKSVGKAPRKNTPTPVSVRGGLGTRGSIYIEPIMIPPREEGMPEVELVQVDYGDDGPGAGVGMEGGDSFQSSALRDSDVFGQGVMIEGYA